jgi:hypothetical protein
MSRYRLLPTPAQEAVLRDHCGHARYVWNHREVLLASGPVADGSLPPDTATWLCT